MQAGVLEKPNDLTGEIDQTGGKPFTFLKSQLAE